MQLLIEPNCDMPWEIYLDWLEDQGHGELRFLNLNFAVAIIHYSPQSDFINGDGCGVGTFNRGCEYEYHGCGESLYSWRDDPHGDGK